MAAIKALELWCKIHCDGYRDVSITNMTTSFRNGLAFCALIHQHRPDLIDYDSLRKEDVLENNRLAFQVAEEKLGIPALLDAEDMVALKIPDRLSVLTYVSQYYNYFNGRNAMGGVKRPAEGAKEELADRKKNLPLGAKTFVSKTATENREQPSLKAQTPPLRSAGTGSAGTRSAGTGSAGTGSAGTGSAGTGSAGTGSAGTTAQNPISAENSHKTETLSSKCVACKSHVHLVQRHFVEGKLYHRSCFRCCDCSSTLHAGSYKPGKAPDTFTCKVHHNSSSSDAGTKNASTTPAPAPRPLSVLSAPLRFTVKSLAPSPSFPSWTASAQKTQSARRKFFQSAPRPEPQTTARKLSENTRDSGKPDTARTKLAEENFNNNNKRLFSVRPAERRFGQEPAVADSLSLRNADSSQDPAGRRTERRAERRTERRAEQPSSRQTNNQEFPRLTVVDKDAAGPTSVHAAAADPDQERKPEAPNIQKDPQDAESQVCDPGFMVQTCKVSVSETKPPSVPAPSGQTGRAAVSVSVALFDPSQLRETSQKTAERCLKPEPPSPVKSPPRRPAEESISSSTPASNPSRAKKGKYLSPTNASRSEMRSPSVKPYHVAAAAAAQIEKELNDIEMNLARLEKEGVELEKKLRRCEDEGDGDVLMDPLMVDWFNLIQKKQMFIRKESELVYTARTQELEQQQPGVEGELRRLMEKPDHLKSREEQQQEQTLMLRLMEIVDDRNAIVENLDEDRLREVEEDQQLNEMMKNLGVKRGKTKRKSSVSKLFRRRSKRQVE